MNLTAAKVRSLAAPGKYGDGGNLYLYISKNRAKSWVLRAMIHGKRREVGLGGYPEVSLKGARRKAVERRRQIARGEAPRVRVPAYAEAATAYRDMNAGRWSASHAKSWFARQEKYAFPVFGDLPVDKVTRTNVLVALTPLWTTRPGAASALRIGIRQVFKWAMAHGHCDGSPAGEAIDGALPSKGYKARHHRAADYRDLPDILRSMDAPDERVSLAVRLAFRMICLTATRPAEVRGARWDEIDTDALEWRIPAGRMKAGAEHRIPLSGAAIAVLEEARILDDGTGLIFPSPIKPGQPLSRNALLGALGRIGLRDATTVHGTRSSFRDWAAERTRASWAAVELCLAHRPGSMAERAYFRSDLMEERRALMQEWADYVAKAA